VHLSLNLTVDLHQTSAVTLPTIFSPSAMTVPFGLNVNMIPSYSIHSTLSFEVVGGRYCGRSPRQQCGHWPESTSFAEGIGEITEADTVNFIRRVFVDPAERA